MLISPDIQYLKEELQKLNNLILQDRAPGQFEWVDSSLVKALKFGHWLFISNANFCRLVFELCIKVL